MSCVCMYVSNNFFSPQGVYFFTLSYNYTYRGSKSLLLKSYIKTLNWIDLNLCITCYSRTVLTHSSEKNKENSQKAAKWSSPHVWSFWKLYSLGHDSSYYVFTTEICSIPLNLPPYLDVYIYRTFRSRETLSASQNSVRRHRCSFIYPIPLKVFSLELCLQTRFCATHPSAMELIKMST